MPKKNDFEIRVVELEAVPAAVTTALGTGTSAKWTQLSVTLPCVTGNDKPRIIPAPQVVVPEISR